MIIYTYAVVDPNGDYDDPCIAWMSAKDARAAAVSYLADRLVATDEADEMLDWTEDAWTRDGRYPTFRAATKYGREVRVWPIELMDPC
jgi:hypothetical protein